MDDFHFKKKYGQNFLKNPRLLQKIATVADYKDDSLVVEVGPGQGALTRAVQPIVKTVLCYEIDKELEKVLHQSFQDKENVHIIFADFLKRDIVTDIKQFSFQHIYFVSNVPYYITTPILFKLLYSHLPFEEVVMLVQKEVGERFAASFGTKQYGALTVLLQYYFDIKKCFSVSRQEFTPVPRVDSVVVSLKRKTSLLFLSNEEQFFKLVHDSFQFKRKTLYNNLKSYPIDKIEPVLKKHGFSLSTRAEQIPYEVFVEMANAL